MERETVVQRARRFLAYKGKEVRVVIGAADYDPERTTTVDGTVVCVAVRKKGNADWRGAQYDLVLDAGGEVAQVFALTRIRSIKEW